MKKFTIFYLLVFVIAKMYGQDYQINFTGSGASNVVDSVIVENITQCTSISLSGVDTLHLFGSAGINELTSNPNQVNIYPNPSTSHYIVEFDIEEKTNVSIDLYNLQGELILKKQECLPEGHHRYQLNGLDNGIYLIKINAALFTYSTKIISNSNVKNNCAEIRYIDYAPPIIKLIKTTNLKTGNLLNKAKTIKVMQYTTGDRLKFTGYSGGIYATIVVLVPTQSQTLSFNFVSCVDVDGNYYSVVEIGTQLWMAENLKTTKYRNGNTISNVSDNTAWSNLSIGAYCNYSNDTNYSAIFGRLYNWYAVNDSRDVAPLGWHVPSFTEWEMLSNYLDSNTVSGGKLKANCTLLWNSPNTGASNESGFTGIAGGFRDNVAVFQEIGNWATWWYSTSMNVTTAYVLVLWHDDDDFGQHYAAKTYGLSVRCIKD
ncbi:MAG: T9SS type A sorting domain-containing protein [Salinivirgaceae bacterium]|nr:T9SS type A sorting domain-containing protein [Salinivirgaceae bacterium]